MTKLVGIDHRADRLDHASAMSSSTTPTTRPSVSYITAPGWPLTQASRWEAPRVRPRRRCNRSVFARSGRTPHELFRAERYAAEFVRSRRSARRMPAVTSTADLWIPWLTGAGIR